jgi:hypothetical protein
VSGEPMPHSNVSEPPGECDYRIARVLQESLLYGEVDPSVLSNFRDPLNRVRNTAGRHSHRRMPSSTTKELPQWLPI